jgi:hypothetical protein
VLRERLANPHILALVCTDEKDEVISGGIVGVEEVCDYAQKAEAAREEDQLILFAQFFEDLLLEFL